MFHVPQAHTVHRTLHHFLAAPDRCTYQAVSVAVTAAQALCLRQAQVSCTVEAVRHALLAGSLKPVCF